MHSKNAVVRIYSKYWCAFSLIGLLLFNLPFSLDTKMVRRLAAYENFGFKFKVHTMSLNSVSQPNHQSTNHPVHRQTDKSFNHSPLWSPPCVFAPLAFILPLKKSASNTFLRRNSKRRMSYDANIFAWPGFTYSVLQGASQK